VTFMVPSFICLGVKTKSCCLGMACDIDICNCKQTSLETMVTIYKSTWCNIRKRIIRIMLCCKQRVSCRNLFRRLKILLLASQYILSLMLFVVKGKNLLILNTEHYATSTRQLNNFYQPMTTLTTYQRGIHYMGVKIFNNLSQSIKEVSSNPRNFEICLKRFLHTHSFIS
jgi:hypothetical protein